MSVQSEITRLNSAKTSIASAIEEKGVTVPSGTMLDEMASLISSIPSGGGTAEDITYDPSETYSDGTVGAALTEQSSRIALKADKPTIKSAMDSVAVPNTQYFLGTQTAVNIVLPSNASAGQQISVVWYNGATAATLSITGTVLNVDYVPSANSRSEINAMWDGSYWAVVTNEQAVSA